MLMGITSSHSELLNFLLRSIVLLVTMIERIILPFVIGGGVVIGVVAG